MAVTVQHRGRAASRSADSPSGAKNAGERSPDELTVQWPGSRTIGGRSMTRRHGDTSFLDLQTNAPSQARNELPEGPSRLWLPIVALANLLIFAGLIYGVVQRLGT